MPYIIDGYEFSDDDITGAAYQAADPIFETHEGELLAYLAERSPEEYRNAEALDIKENGYADYEANPSLSQLSDCVQTVNGQRFLDDISDFVNSVPMI